MKLFARFALIWLVCLPFFSMAQSAPPRALVREVTDEYFGTQVIDPYRWLEKTSDPEVAAWMRAQNDYTRAVLAKSPDATSCWNASSSSTTPAPPSRA